MEMTGLIEKIIRAFWTRYYSTKDGSISYDNTDYLICSLRKSQNELKRDVLIKIIIEQAKKEFRACIQAYEGALTLDQMAELMRIMVNHVDNAQSADKLPMLKLMAENIKWYYDDHKKIVIQQIVNADNVFDNVYEILMNGTLLDQTKYGLTTLMIEYANSYEHTQKVEEVMIKFNLSLYDILRDKLFKIVEHFELDELYSCLSRYGIYSQLRLMRRILVLIYIKTRKSPPKELSYYESTDKRRDATIKTILNIQKIYAILKSKILAQDINKNLAQIILHMMLAKLSKEHDNYEEISFVVKHIENIKPFEKLKILLDNSIGFAQCRDTLKYLRDNIESFDSEDDVAGIEHRIVKYLTVLANSSEEDCFILNYVCSNSKMYIEALESMLKREKSKFNLLPTN